MLARQRRAGCRAEPSRSRRPPQPPMRESGLPEHRQKTLSMDIEQVNAIGMLLTDLSARTEQLRGHL